MKKSKRFTFLVLIVLLVVALGLSACQPAAPAAEEPAAEEPVAEAPAAEEPAAEEPAVEEPAEEVEEEKEPLNVAFVFGGPVNDYSWNQLWYEGKQTLDEHYGDQIETVFVDHVPWSEEATQVMEQLVADGAEVIVETSGYYDFFFAVAEAHPEVTFLSINPALYDNTMMYNFEALRAHYLIGVAAGLLTENDKIGYVAPMPGNPNLNAWFNAIAMGMRSVNPDATFNLAYTGAYYDPPAARQAAEALADSGVDVLFAYPNVDIVMEVAEERGLWTFGRYHPMGDFAPNTYVTTFLVESGDFFIDEVQAILDGTWEGKEFRYIPLGEGIFLDEWGANVPQEVIDEVEALYDRMVQEGYNPLIGPVYDNEGNLVVPEGEELTEDPYSSLGVEWLVEGIVSSE